MTMNKWERTYPLRTKAADMALIGGVVITGALLATGVAVTLIVASPWLVVRWLDEPL